MTNCWDISIPHGLLGRSVMWWSWRKEDSGNWTHLEGKEVWNLGCVPLLQNRYDIKYNSFWAFMSLGHSCLICKRRTLNLVIQDLFSQLLHVLWSILANSFSPCSLLQPLAFIFRMRALGSYWEGSKALVCGSGSSMWPFYES